MTHSPDTPATPEGDAVSRALPNAYYECAGCTQQGCESNCRPAEEIRLAPDETWLCEYCYDDAAYECGEDANWPVWADIPKLSAVLPSPQNGERDLAGCKIALEQAWASCREHIARAEKAEAALVGASAIISADADLLSIEVDALKSGISVGDVMSPGPEDAHTVEAISEIEAWIADAAGFVNGAAALTAPPVAQVSNPDCPDFLGDGFDVPTGGVCACATPAPVEAGLLDGLLATWAGLTESAEADLAEDIAEAETTGERPDLWAYKLEVGLDDARDLIGFLTSLRPLYAPVGGETQG